MVLEGKALLDTCGSRLNKRLSALNIEHGTSNIEMGESEYAGTEGWSGGQTSMFGVDCSMLDVRFGRNCPGSGPLPPGIVPAEA
jgi:hypothetical protein